jgi:hypothetical protein
MGYKYRIVLVNGDCERTPSTNTKYYHSLLTVNGMKGKSFVIGVLVLGFFLHFNTLASQAQKSSKTLTLLYSNNINGEIEPCPT